MIGIEASPLLKINRVVVTGDLGCDIELGSGTNVVKGEPFSGDVRASNDCGKTVFTDLIKYGLGDRDRFTTGEIARSIEVLFLEMELNGNVLTVARNLNKPAARVSIYKSKYQRSVVHEEPDMRVSPKTPYSDFILEQLGIPKVSVPQSSKPGSNIRPITFQDLMRVLYMDQKNSFQEIMYKVQPDWLKTKILQILLGMSKVEEEQLSISFKKLTDEIADLEREIKNVADFLIKSEESSLLETTKRKDRLIQQLELLTSQISLLKQRMRGQRGITDVLRDSLQEINHRLAELQESRAKLLFKIKDFRALLNSLTVDRERIRKTQEATYLLSTVDFVRCPRCLQRITAGMKKREENANCMLCGRALLTETGRTRVLDKDEIVDEEIKEVRVLLERYQQDLQSLNEQIDLLSMEKTQLQEDLDRRSRSYVSPFVDELERLLNQRTQIRANIELLDQQVKRWRILREKEEQLSNLRIERKRLGFAIAAIDTRDETKIRNLSNYYEGFLHDTGFPGLRTARIDPANLMPLVNGRMYTEDTGSGFVSVKVIGYHYALLRFSLDFPCYYPRFLMLDSPRAFDINPETYHRVLLQFLKLLDRRSEQDFQVIITTRDLPEEMEQYVVERINSRSRMLLRPKGQREQSSPPH